MRIALIQQLVGPEKSANIQRAHKLVQAAKQKGSDLVVLPEFFSTPYSLKHFGEENGEFVPQGPTCQFMSKVALENKLWLVAGILLVVSE